MFSAATAKWEGLCKLKSTCQGATSTVPDFNSTYQNSGRVNVFGWVPFTGSNAGSDGYVRWFYEYGGTNGNMIDADMYLNTARTWTQSNKRNLEALITHELGHVLGLNHSNLGESVMFADPYNTYSYQLTPRGGDARACAALYGESPNAGANRVFNWAERTYSQLAAPGAVPSKSLDVYYYRRYSETNSYLAVSKGEVFYPGPDGKLLDAAALSGYASAAAAAGF